MFTINIEHKFSHYTFTICTPDIDHQPYVLKESHIRSLILPVTNENIACIKAITACNCRTPLLKSREYNVEFNLFT